MCLGINVLQVVVAVQLYLKVSWCIATAIVQGRSVFVGVENNDLMQIKLCTLAIMHSYVIMLKNT